MIRQDLEGDSVAESLDRISEGFWGASAPASCYLLRSSGQGLSCFELPCGTTGGAICGSEKSRRSDMASNQGCPSSDFAEETRSKRVLLYSIL